MALKEAVIYGAISAVFSTIRVLLSPTKPTIVEYFIAAFISVPVGMIAGFVAVGHDVEQGIVFAIVASSALIAENLIKLVIMFGTRLQKDPQGTIAAIRKTMKGS